MLNKIKGRMRELNITQKELSKKVGITQASLNRKLNRKNEFKLSEIIKIAETLNIEPIDLVELQVKEERS